jgi:hypothetical protein
MSPVARRQSHSGRALALSAAVVVLALGLAVGVAILANRGDVEVRLGDDVFQAGEAESLAEQIEQDGPILVPDVAGGDRDIVLQHLSDDPRQGWRALAARPPGVSRDCTIRWEDGIQLFVLLDDQGEQSGDCDGRSFPPDGTGLPRYAVDLREGELYVDLHATEEPTTSPTS